MAGPRKNCYFCYRLLTPENTTFAPNWEKCWKRCCKRCRSTRLREKIKPPTKVKEAKQKSRLEILFEKDPNCHYCRKRLTRSTATLDHIVPRSKAGSNKLYNLTLACSRCNNEKGDSDYHDYMALIKSRLDYDKRS